MKCFLWGIKTTKKPLRNTPSVDITEEQINQLKRWKDMFDMELIDEEEYKNKKKLILG